MQRYKSLAWILVGLLAVVTLFYITDLTLGRMLW